MNFLEIGALYKVFFWKRVFFYFRQREVLSETYDVGDEFISIGDGFSCTVSNQNNAVVEGMCESVAGDRKCGKL